MCSDLMSVVMLSIVVVDLGVVGVMCVMWLMSGVWCLCVS